MEAYFATFMGFGLKGVLKVSSRTEALDKWRA